MSNKPTDGHKDKWKNFAEQQQDESLDPIDQPAADQPQATDKNLEYIDRQKLEDQLTAMEQEVAQYKDQHLRAMAQLKNAQERAERDVVSARKFGTERLITDLLPVVDSLVRGLETVQVTDAKSEKVREGLQLTLDLLNKVLIKHGIEIINPQPGTPFNPEFHEAMTMQTVPDAVPNSIVQVLQPGYALHGRVLRAAMVIVAG